MTKRSNKPKADNLPATVPTERPKWATAELSDQEMLFVSAYLDSFSGKQAAIAAGYAKSGAAVRGHELRRRPHVASAIQTALNERMSAMRSRIVEETSKLPSAARTAPPFRTGCGHCSCLVVSTEC
jgi:hypothetical protein